MSQIDDKIFLSFIILFTLYKSPLESAIDTHNIHKICFVCADDTAFKRNCDFGDTTEISNCVRSVKEWSQVNRMKLNSIKTEFIHVSLRHRLRNPMLTLNLDTTLVHATKTCRNLVVTFDDTFTFENFVLQNVAQQNR